MYLIVNKQTLKIVYPYKRRKIGDGRYRKKSQAVKSLSRIKAQQTELALAKVSGKRTYEQRRMKRIPNTGDLIVISVQQLHILLDQKQKIVDAERAESRLGRLGK